MHVERRWLPDQREKSSSPRELGDEDWESWRNESQGHNGLFFDSFEDEDEDGAQHRYFLRAFYVPAEVRNIFKNLEPVLSCDATFTLARVMFSCYASTTWPPTLTPKNGSTPVSRGITGLPPLLFRI